MPDPGCAEAHCARAWPFEAMYNATGYGDYPFWTGGAPPGRQSGLATSSSGAHIHTTWSAVVKDEKLIERNDTISTEKGQTFMMHADNQSNVLIQVVKGERARTENNDSLGGFHLDRIPPAPHGMPQFEVIFDIDTHRNRFANELGGGTV